MTTDPIPQGDGQLGLTITEVSDFTFAFQDPAFLNALAARAISTPAQLANEFVTPRMPGSFGSPEGSRRIVKAQVYYRESAANNLYAKPIEGMQAIMDLNDRVMLQVIDTGVVQLPAATQEFDEASVDAQIGLRPALKPIRISQPEGQNFSFDGNFVDWQKWRFHVRFDRRTVEFSSAKSPLRRGSRQIPRYTGRRPSRAVDLAPLPFNAHQTRIHRNGWLSFLVCAAPVARAPHSIDS